METKTATQYPGEPATRYEMAEICDICGSEFTKADLFAIDLGGRPCHRDCYEQFGRDMRDTAEWKSNGTAIEIRQGRYCYEVRWLGQQEAKGLCDSHQAALLYAIELRKYRFPKAQILDHTVESASVLSAKGKR